MQTLVRVACGYALANQGHTRALQAYLGHRNIQHTVRYTELAPTRTKDFCDRPTDCWSNPVTRWHPIVPLKEIDIGIGFATCTKSSGKHLKVLT
jgi:hypothetical protein